MVTKYPGVTFVRHPFARLFSAWQDKWVAAPIFLKYMDLFHDEKGDFIPPSFAAFVDLLLIGTAFPIRDIHMYPMLFSCAMCDIK